MAELLNDIVEPERLQLSETGVSDGDPQSQYSDEHRERIAQCAYYRFQARGSEHVHDHEDWLDAERELRQQREHEDASHTRRE